MGSSLTVAVNAEGAAFSVNAKTAPRAVSCRTFVLEMAYAVNINAVRLVKIGRVEAIMQGWVAQHHHNGFSVQVRQ